MESIQDISRKYALTLTEAAKYFNIGQNKIRELCELPGCKFGLKVGTKLLVKRELFEQYLDKNDLI